MSDFPRSLIEIQRRFPDEEACAAYLYTLRWPEGFRCPICGHDRAWELGSKTHTYECTACHRQISLTSGTIMHDTHLPLTAWIWAAFLMGAHSNGIAATQLRSLLNLGSYKTAWLLARKLRSVMVRPGREPLQGLVEIDETSIPHRTASEPVSGGQGRSGQGKMKVVVAIEVLEKGLGRIRLQSIADYSAATLQGFIDSNVAPGSTIRTDGWGGYSGTPEIAHDPRVVGTMAAHVLLPWVHRIISNLKTWALGVYHGLRRKHLQAYLDEFVFRFNRRRNRPRAAASLLGLAMHAAPRTYKMLIRPESGG